jgi:hypothetical protein
MYTWRVMPPVSARRNLHQVKKPPENPEVSARPPSIACCGFVRPSGSIFRFDRCSVMSDHWRYESSGKQRQLPDSFQTREQGVQLRPQPSKLILMHRGELL